MSLGSALTASVSGLKAQSAAIAAVSENIANASTTAYKKREISFQSLVTSSNIASSLNQVGGGVTFQTNQKMNEQGLIQNTGVSTNIAIGGQGFFVVTDDVNNQPAGFTYTRNGDFSTNEEGLLINNEGMILLGQSTDEDGSVTAANSGDLSSLEAIDFGAIGGTAQATTAVEMDINLPATSDLYTGAPGDPEYVTAFEIFDGLGIGHTIEATFRKTAVNTWTIDYTDPYRTDLGSGSTATGTIAPTTQTLVFNGDGSINTIDGAAAAPFNVAITGFTTSTGAADVTFELDLGTQNLFDGLTQFSSSISSEPDIEIAKIEGDGVRFGKLSGVEIDDAGLVTALFDNGVRRPIYQIPIATFPNPEGLTNVFGTVFDENQNAGNLNLSRPGIGDAGNVIATSLELSTVDTSEEFNKMIVAQQAYSSAAQIVATVDDMFDTLLTAVR
ncbi:MAG: flagellar hook protein FlgE [Bdellovibrionales bacterium]